MKGPGARGRGPALVALCASLAFGATTTTWEMTGYQDFLHGRLGGLSLTADGALVLGPKLDTIFTSDQPEIWSVAKAPDGSLYLGTGNGGRLYKIDAAGKSSAVWTADQPEIFAVAIDSKGAVYAGTSPDGKIYRIENGKASEYFDPHARYIWALKAAPDGTLYAGTGGQGKIYRITSAGKGELYYDTQQSHVTALAIDGQGRLLAGTEPNGILYRISGKDKAFVLYDASLPEIRALSAAPDGAIYAVAMGGSLAKRTQGLQQNVPAQSGGPVVAAAGTTISVTAESEQAGPEIKPQPDPSKPAPVAPPPVTTSFSPTVDVSGVE